MDTHSDSNSPSNSPTNKSHEDQPIIEQDLRSPSNDAIEFPSQEPLVFEPANPIEENQSNVLQNDSKPQKNFASAIAQRNRRKLLELKSGTNSNLQSSNITASQALVDSNLQGPYPENARKPRLPPINHTRVLSGEIPQANSCEVSRDPASENMQNRSQEGRQSQLEELGSSDFDVQDEYKKNFYSHVMVKSRPQSSSLFKNASHVIKKNAVAPMINTELPSRNSSPNQMLFAQEYIPQGGAIVTVEQPKKSRFGRDMEKGSQSGFQKLEAMNGIVLKQKFHVFKEEKGWQPPYRTYVHDYDMTDSQIGDKMFQCNEISSYCMQQCLCNYCRPYSVLINTCNAGESPDDHKPFLLLERVCSCSCLWFNRPAISVKLVEEGNDLQLGMIKDAFTWGGIKLEVMDKYGALRYTIQGDCCQWGLFCNCACNSCENINFLVKSAGVENSMDIVKKNTGFSKVEFPNADRFFFGFTHEIPVEDKALLLSALLFLESRHFEGDL